MVLCMWLCYFASRWRGSPSIMRVILGTSGGNGFPQIEHVFSGGGGGLAASSPNRITGPGRCNRQKSASGIRTFFNLVSRLFIFWSILRIESDPLSPVCFVFCRLFYGI